MIHNFHDRLLSPVDQTLMGAIPSHGDLKIPNRFPLRSLHFYRKSFTFPFVELYNNNRRYHDEGPLELNFSYNSGTLGKNQQNVSREKYIFSHSHFGHYSDLIDTAKDSRYKINSVQGEVISGNNDGLPQNIIPTVESAELKLSISPPVHVRFVTSSIAQSEDKFYYEISGSRSNNSLNKFVDARIVTQYTDTHNVD